MERMQPPTLVPLIAAAANRIFLGLAPRSLGQEWCGPHIPSIQEEKLRRLRGLGSCWCVRTLPEMMARGEDQRLVAREVTSPVDGIATEVVQ